MAEVYWDLEWKLQQHGFDYTYDKRLYDRLHEQHPQSVREHFWADLDYQKKSTRFLENHDEPRAAATFPTDIHQAAAIVTFLCSGLRFFHQGQLQGWKTKISVHLCRFPEQATDPSLQDFYLNLLKVLNQSLFRDGNWRLLPCKPAWDGNWTWDCFIAFAWEEQDGKRAIAVVNYAPHQSQCYLALPWADMSNRTYQLKDLMGITTYKRSGEDLLNSGLYLDLVAWGYHIFELL